MLSENFLALEFISDASICVYHTAFQGATQEQSDYTPKAFLKNFKAFLYTATIIIIRQ